MPSKKVPFYHIQQGQLGQTGDFSISDLEFVHEHMPHRHDHYSIYVVLAGKTNHLLDFQEYSINAPALIFVSPGQIHSVVSSSEAETITIAFTSSFLMTMDAKDLDHLFNTNMILLNREEFAEVSPYIELLQKEFGEIKGNSTLFSGLLTAFLQKCELVFHKYHDETEKEHYNQIFQRFLALIDEKFKKLTKVTDYAALLYITAGHLNDIVKDVTGKNAKQFIDDRRILEAKRLVYWSGNSIKTIAWELGFEDPAYFARYFRRHTGELPKDFKLRINKQAST